MKPLVITIKRGKKIKTVPMEKINSIDDVSAVIRGQFSIGGTFEITIKAKMEGGI